MKVRTIWKEKMKFIGKLDANEVQMDAHSPIGNDSGFTPKELVAIGIAGCTGMDVVALLKKYKEPLESFEIETEATLTEKVQPTVFKDITLKFVLIGKISKDKVLEAVRLSQSKYCGVSAMIAKTAPIHYEIILNSEKIGEGKSAFDGRSE